MKIHYNCLVVDDEIELAEATCEYFEMFDVKSAYVKTANECVNFLESNKVDLLLLDINLQDESGFNLCKKIRETSQIPILFISARQSDDDILIALNIGGDDYIKKPYTLSILLAKVKVMLKRMVPVNIEDSEVSSERLQLHQETLRVTVDGKESELRSKEFRLLQVLYQNNGKIVTKDELFSKVWENDFYSDGTLNVHIRKLREKIEVNPNEPQLIKTVWGVGYILEA